MAGNITCPLGPSALPVISTLPIPQNINVVVRPGVSTADEAMAACCSPNRLQIADGCYLWCEIPARYFNQSADHDTMSQHMTSCIRAENKGRNITNEAIITGFQFNVAGRVGVARGLGVWVLLVSGLVWAM
ncbi:hypothetical protein C8A05DRAFT_29962 [Staphylotrichum tortipilum]|uniref:Uncharacterized protein n=1 Tax=Staphylotrichum tortipilum TaxID=2831512 RepID=A0AAN6MTJ2_9PEZI|nr:hypothetical protein C8A05DRAFT_29962 [Staphylotrichum longicolle]